MKGREGKGRNKEKESAASCPFHLVPLASVASAALELGLALFVERADAFLLVFGRE